MLLALLMAAGVLHMAVPLRAQDLVCGDGLRETPEACDDGNLKNGDGCSSTCAAEVCGNNVIDFNEQCDDGNAVDGDGCSRFCQIEFCGDRIVQSAQGEQCDDGNGIGGDGCSAACVDENPVDHSAPPPEDEPPPASAPPSVIPTAPPVLDPPPGAVQGVQQMQVFLNTPASDDYKSYLSDQELFQLEAILNKLRNGRLLTPMEREWAMVLYEKLQDARIAERERYTDLLREFISTPISTEVVDEKELDKQRLVDVQVPVAIEELESAVDIIRRGELKNQVDLDIAKLYRQEIDIEKLLPSEYEANLTAGAQPIAVFATLKTLKEETERHATKDLPQSLAILRDEASELKQSLAVFQREYGLAPEEVEPLLTAIENVSLEVTKENTDRIVGAVNRFMNVLDRRKIFTKADIAGFELETAHAAAAADRLIKKKGDGDEAESPEKLAEFLEGLAESATPEARMAYSVGTVQEQRAILLDLLESDERIAELRGMLRGDGRTDFDERYDILHDAVKRAGGEDTTGIGCDDSIDDALRCTDEYLRDLQDAARNRNFFNQFIGPLQDFFGIGS